MRQAGPEDALAEAVEALLERRLLVAGRRSSRRCCRARCARRSRPPPRGPCRAPPWCRGRPWSLRSASGASSATGWRASLADAALSPVSAASSAREVDGLHEARVGGDGVARLELEDVARHDARAAGTTTTSPPRRTRALGAVMLLQRVERRLGAALLARSRAPR